MDELFVVVVVYLKLSENLVVFRRSEGKLRDAGLLIFAKLLREQHVDVVHNGVGFSGFWLREVRRFI